MLLFFLSYIDSGRLSGRWLFPPKQCSSFIDVRGGRDTTDDVNEVTTDFGREYTE